MSASKIASGAGLRHVRFWLIDSNGYPDGTQSGSDGYAGTRIEGAKTFTANLPDVQTIRHTGDDRVFAQDSLPPTELETAALTTGKTNLTVDALLTDTLVRTLGDLQIAVRGTDKQGFEPTVCIYGWRQSVDTDDTAGSNYGRRQYHTVLYPKARVVPKGGSMAEQTADENAYNLIPTPVQKYPWGEAVDETHEGATETIKFEIKSDNPWVMERYTAPGAVVNFLTDFTPISAAKCQAWDDGIAATVSAVDTTNKFITLSAPPSAQSVVVILYETTDLT